MPLISIKKLSLSYESVKVIDSLSFDVHKGDCIAIVGENGSGKSTLIKALLGLKEPSSGEIKYSYNKNEAGFLPQQILVDKNFPATVSEVVRTGCLSKKRFLSFYNKNDKEKARINIKKLDIEDIASRPFSSLSGGQKQRVLLARALCSAEKIIFLDEPFASLDPKASKSLYELIEKINREDLMTVIMVSHDILSAVKYANKILHINEDDIFFGETEKYLKSSYYKNILN